MEENQFLKIIHLSKSPVIKFTPLADPLSRFCGIVLNLTSNALDCLQRLARKEMEKKSPSANIMEEYYLLQHYLDFIKRLCLEKRT